MGRHPPGAGRAGRLDTTRRLTVPSFVSRLVLIAQVRTLVHAQILPTESTRTGEGSWAWRADHAWMAFGPLTSRRCRSILLCTSGTTGREPLRSTTVIPVTRLRIALVPSLFAPNLGGVERVTADLGSELVRRGSDVVVITNRWPVSLPSCEIVDGLRCHPNSIRASRTSNPSTSSFRLSFCALSRQDGVGCQTMRCDPRAVRPAVMPSMDSRPHACCAGRSSSPCTAN